MKLSLLTIVIGLSISGCTTVDLQSAALRAEEGLVEKNDAYLRISTKGLCSSSLTAISRQFAGDPERLRALLVLCGWSDGNIDIITNDK